MYGENLENVASYLFGKENLKTDSEERALASNPLALLCKDSKLQESFEGVNVDGFEVEFCNKTNAIQTDVGICVVSDAKQVMFNSNIFKTSEMKMVGGGRKDAEHVMILMADKFGQLNNPPEFIVSIDKS